VLNKTVLIHQLGRIPFIGSVLRWFARLYTEGSVVTIKNGHLAGYKWKRSHKYLTSYWLGTFELPIQNCLARELRPEDVFYDIGANAGFFSLLGSKCVGDKGHVFAFEPLPENIEMIQNQFELNHVTNCTLIKAAVSDRVGETEFCEGPDTSTAHIGSRGKEQTGVYVVKTITLDYFIKAEHPPDFIKMDIEGAEILALQGARELLNKPNSPKFLIEIHGQGNAKEVREIFEKEGYFFYTPDLKEIDSDCMPRHVLALPKKTMK